MKAPLLAVLATIANGTNGFGSVMTRRIRRACLEDAFIFLWFLLLTSFLVLQRNFPYLYDDEYGVLGAAAVLAGLDWGAPDGMPFYGFGLSILIAPLYKLALDPVTLYRSVLSANGLLIASSAVLASRSLRLTLPPLGSWKRVLVVIAAFSYPAVLFYAGLAMGETLLLFCFVLIAYALISLVGVGEPKSSFAILLGFGLGLAPYTNTRGLVFWLAIAPVLLLASRDKSLAPRTIVKVLISAVLVSVVLAGIKAWLVENFYGSIRPGTGSAIAFIVSRTALLDWDQLAVVARVAFGQFSYLVTSSFGLVFAGLAGIVVGRSRYAEKTLSTFARFIV